MTGSFSEKDRRIWNDLFAEVPDSWRQAPPSLAMRTCAEWLHEAGTREILDIGCGVGRWSIWLSRQGFRLSGADFAPRAVEHTRQWASDEGLEIPVSCTPIVQRAFPERRFDAAIAALVFDLVSKDEFEAALSVLHDSLRPSGHLFAVFNPVEKQDDLSNPTEGITRVEYSDEEIAEIVGHAGFDLLRRARLDLDTRGFLWQRVPPEPSSDGSA